MTLSDWYHDQMQDLIGPFMSKGNPTGAEPVPKAALMNETQNHTISVETGKTYLFRLINIGAFAGQYVWIEGHNMTVVEVDGVYTKPKETDMIYLSVAQRCSFLVTTRNDTGANFPIIGSMDTVSTAVNGLAGGGKKYIDQLSLDAFRYVARRLKLQRHRLARV